MGAVTLSGMLIGRLGVKGYDKEGWEARSKITMANQRLLKLALSGLEIERQLVDSEIVDLQRQLTGQPVSPSEVAPARLPRRRGISAAGRKAISDAMKARWAARRNG